MAQTPTPERTTIINGSGGGNGGMGMGIILGAILVLVLGVLWFVMSGKISGPGTDTNNPTIDIKGPDINFPDTITINPPAPANTPAP